MRVLFFGRADCEKSVKLLQLMEELKVDVTHHFCSSRDELIPKDLASWSGDYIFSFRFLTKIKTQILGRARCFAINFHPAPPDYPGTGSCNWAVFEGQKYFGVTAHIMEEKIDSGKILECVRFPISEEIDAQQLWKIANDKNYELAKNFISGIHKNGEEFIHKRLLNHTEKWSGNTRKISDLDKLQEIPLDASKEEVNKIIKSVNFPGHPPYVLIHGHKFDLSEK